MLDLRSSVALETTKSTTKKETRKLLAVSFFALFALMSFEVNVCQNVRVVFVKYMIQMYKKKKNEKFYGCEKLYFTELLYEQKRKARDRKENFTIAPLQSCFVTVSVFVVISVGLPQYRGSRNRSRVCATLPLYRCPLSK